MITTIEQRRGGGSFRRFRQEQTERQRMLDRQLELLDRVRSVRVSILSQPAGRRFNFNDE